MNKGTRGCKAKLGRSFPRTSRASFARQERAIERAVIQGARAEIVELLDDGADEALLDFAMDWGEITHCTCCDDLAADCKNVTGL